MPKYTRRDLPVLLNYTGKHIETIPIKDTRGYHSKDGKMCIPPIGKPKIRMTSVKEPDALYPTIECIVEGIPPELPGALIIVNEDIAKLLCNTRKDILIPYNITNMVNDSMINPNEFIIICDGLAHYMVSSTSKR